MQTKKQSLTEAISNTAVGFIVSYLSTFVIFPLVGVETNAGTNLVIVIYFTAVSILRSYVIRRWFNKKVVNNIIKEPMLGELEHNAPHQYCFNCEIEMPVKVVNGDLRCSNCGTIHTNIERTFKEYIERCHYTGDRCDNPELCADRGCIIQSGALKVYYNILIGKNKR